MRLLISVLPFVGCAVMSLRCRRMRAGGQCSAPAASELEALRAEVAPLRRRPAEVPAEIGR